MTELRVELYGEHVGTLVGAGDDFDFIADPEALRTFTVGSTVLSLAVPLAVKNPPRQKQRRAAFFAGLLPEGDATKVLARSAGLSVGDTMGMLREYGRDIAGAVQIWDPTAPGEPRTPTTEPLDDAGVAALLGDVAAQPLGNKPRRGKTSLTGVQPKIVLARTADGWARAVDGYPSTHIVKPQVGAYRTMIFDEEYGSRFARALGLADFDTRLETFAGVPGLIIERYDRRDGERIHQEDFSQILGLREDAKYERFEGRPLRDVARVLSPADRFRLLQMVVLSVAVGNLDLHAKNISVVHERTGSHHLAPMYDVVPQTFHDNDGEMAFRIGGEFEHRRLTVEHLVREASSWGIDRARAETVVAETLAAIDGVATTQTPHPGAQADLNRIVERFATNLRAGRAAGDDGDGLPDTEVRQSPGGWDNPAAIRG